MIVGYYKNCLYIHRYKESKICGFAPRNWFGSANRVGPRTGHDSAQLQVEWTVDGLASKPYPRGWREIGFGSTSGGL